MQSDNSKSQVNAAANSAKSSVRLDPDSQAPKFSGHSSGKYGTGGPSAGGTSNKSPGTGSYGS